MVAEVAVAEAVHQAVGQRVELLGGAGLGNARASAVAGRRECRRREVAVNEGRIGRRREIGVELPDVQGRGVVSESDEGVGRPRGRGRGAVEVGRQQAAVEGRELEADLRGGVSGQHFGALKGAGAGAGKGIATEHVEADVVAVGPDADLRVIVEIGLREGIAVPRSSRVGGR